MLCKAYIDLSERINEQQRRFASNGGLGIFIAIFGLVPMFIVGGKVIDFKTICCFVIFLVTMGYITYLRIFPNGIIINNTAIEVEILEGKIIVKTSPFNVLSCFKQDSKVLEFNLNEVKIRKTSYPFKPLFDLDNQVIKLTDYKKEAYIIIDYFDSELKENLLAIKKEYS